MRRVVIVQARMTSSRLPGKVLAEFGGRPMLAYQLARVRRAELVDEIVIACTDRPEDDPVADLAASEGATVVRGDEHDVLGRYLMAARAARADMVVRLTADCPFTDPAEIDAVVGALAAAERTHDYASNLARGGLPLGFAVEAFWRDTLERAARMATSAPAREHVTYFIHGERRDLFSVLDLERPFDGGDLRVTVDVAADLELARLLAGELSADVSVEGVIAALRANPEWVAINAAVGQKRPGD